MSKRLIRALMAAFSLLANGYAFYQLNASAAGLSVPARWYGQFGLLLLMSSVLTSALPFLDNAFLVYPALCARTLLTFFVSLPLGECFWPRMTLAAALLIEVIEYCPLYCGILAALLILAGLDVFFQAPIKAWGKLLPPPPPDIRLAFYFYGLPIILLGSIMSYQKQRQVPAADFDNRLHLATVQLAEANMKLQEYAALAEQEAAANERKRVAREIHDTLAYTLTTLVMMLEAALDMARGNESLAAHLKKAREQAKDGLADVRDALRALRPVEPSAPMGLAALHRLIQAFTSATDIKITLSMGDTPRDLPGEYEYTIYRLIQEGITNALRHGHAKEIVISFFQKSGGLEVTIKDDGIGTSGIEEGFGLLGMRERIERLGGRMAFLSEPGKGFILEVWLPL